MFACSAAFRRWSSHGAEDGVQEEVPGVAESVKVLLGARQHEATVVAEEGRPCLEKLGHVSQRSMVSCFFLTACFLVFLLINHSRVQHRATAIVRLGTSPDFSAVASPRDSLIMLSQGRKVVKKMRKTRLTLYLQEIREHGAVLRPQFPLHVVFLHCRSAVLLCCRVCRESCVFCSSGPALQQGSSPGKCLGAS